MTDKGWTCENIDRDVTGKCKSEKEARKEGKNSDKAEFKVTIIKGDGRNRLQAGLPFGSAEGWYTWETDLCSTYLLLNTEGCAKGCVVPVLCIWWAGRKGARFSKLWQRETPLLKQTKQNKNTEKFSLLALDLQSNFMPLTGDMRTFETGGSAAVAPASHNFLCEFCYSLPLTVFYTLSFYLMEPFSQSRCCLICIKKEMIQWDDMD